MATDPQIRSARAPIERAEPHAARPPEQKQPASPPPPEVPLAELVARHAAAEERWRRALIAANSGRPVELAELALAQDAYVRAQADLDRGQVEDTEHRRRLAELRARRMEAESRLTVILAQEERWHEVSAHPPKRGGVLGGLRRLLRR